MIATINNAGEMETQVQLKLNANKSMYIDTKMKTNASIKTNANTSTHTNLYKSVIISINANMYKHANIALCGKRTWLGTYPYTYG